MLFGFSRFAMKVSTFFPLRTSADHKEHPLKAEGGKKSQTIFLPSNHDFIHEKHYFRQQRLNKDLRVLSYPTKDLQICFPGR